MKRPGRQRNKRDHRRRKQDRAKERDHLRPKQDQAAEDPPNGTTEHHRRAARTPADNEAKQPRQPKQRKTRTAKPSPHQ
ncbi:hypothetical protein GCM10022380_56730 [Amycolatopsis tucumanensis]|uniref:Uncharacterized protein n=1 Tax=Amycolatopsis tucumanensis TaxID=401106 RepID=A0ABP7IZ45_9PSEU